MFRVCSPEIADAFAREGGTNQYGEPIFKLAWAQYETRRAGGFWESTGRAEYRDFLLGGNEPCWMLMMWKPAESFGSDVRWYWHHRDEASGLQELGEYPYSGEYVVLHKFIHREMRDGVMHVENLELSGFLVDVALAAAKSWQALSEEERLAALKLEMELEEEALLNEMMDAKANCAPAFRGATASFGNQGCRTSVIARKVEVMERGMREAMRMAAQMSKGLTQLPG